MTENTNNLEEQIKKSLEGIRPFLQQDGGDLEFVELEGTLLKLRLKGACGHCPMATMTLKNGIEQTLKKEVNPEIEVISVP